MEETVLSNTNRLKRATVLLIALTVAVIYSFSLVACILIVRSDGSIDTVGGTSSLNSIGNTSHSTVSSDISSSSDQQTSSGGSSSENVSSEDSVSSEQSASSDEDTSSDVGSVSSEEQTSSNPEPKPEPKPEPSKPSFEAAIWYSYIDFDFKNDNAGSFKQKINKMFDDAVSVGADAVICQVRPFADALYYSSYFPMSSVLTGTQGKDPGYDALEYMVKAAHERGLQIHAWLNPYRITIGTTDITTLAKSHPARVWLEDDDPANDRNVLIWDKRLYFNPSVPEVQKLVLDGVREIVQNYDVDGIHIDDYFYPSDTPVGDGFDKPEYEAYASKGGQLSLGDWRRNNVNTLVQGMYRAVKSADNTLLFGVSPSYHISKLGIDDNYTLKYADLKKWMNTDGYIDYIVPQLYFGYEYPSDTIKYDYLLKLWMSMERTENVRIYIGLAAYKIGDDSADLSSGEWTTNDDILAKQTLDAKQNGCDGVFVFAYSSLFSDDELNIKQKENLKQALVSAKQE